MNAVWLRARNELRSRWRALISLALIAGIGGGAAIAAVAMQSVDPVLALGWQTGGENGPVVRSTTQETSRRAQDRRVKPKQAIRARTIVRCLLTFKLGRREDRPFWITAKCDATLHVLRKAKRVERPRISE